MPIRKEDLDTFIRRQSAGTLAAWLLNLGQANPEAQVRLERLHLADKSDWRAAAFRKGLNG